MYNQPKSGFVCANRPLWVHHITFSGVPQFGKPLLSGQPLLLYIGVTISILIGYKHAANSCWLCFRYVIPTDNSFYTCRSDVIPTDNSFMHAEVTSPNTLNSSLSNFVMAESTSRFATLSAENLDLLLDDKDVN